MKSVVSSPIKVHGSYRARLGETPVWCTRSQSLLWVDILEQRLLRYWPGAGGRTEIHVMPPLASAVLLTTQKETFLVVSQSGIWLYDYLHQGLTAYCEYPSEAAGTRPNEAVVAPDGALWFSTMDPAAEKPTGSWYRLAPGERQARCVLSNQLVPNTLQWHEGNIWFADSLRQHIYCAQWSGTQLIELAAHHVEGIPDGSALTTEGQLINARWGQSQLVRYQLSGIQLQAQDNLSLPVTQPSSCTFGGPDFSELYITSAREGLAQPSETDGALLSLSTTLTGLPAALFGI